MALDGSLGGNEGPINSGPKNEHVGFDEAILNESFVA